MPRGIYVERIAFSKLTRICVNSIEMKLTLPALRELAAGIVKALASYEQKA